MKPIDGKLLDHIVKQTIAAVEKGKAQIFDIYEAARAEIENVKRDVERIKQEAADIIFKVDELETKQRRARFHLMEVSRNFRIYTEEDIRKAYEEASNLQVALAVAREREQSLRHERDAAEIRLRSLKRTVEKAEGLVTQVGAALGYLGARMNDVAAQIDSLQQKQLFGAKIIKAQEEERRRVAREIHDGPAQSMANIVFRAEVCKRLVDTDVDRARVELQDLQEQVRFCLKETRKIIFDLRPMTLDDLGLVPTVRRVLDKLKERSKIITEIKVLGEGKRLPTHYEVGLFRIIQEALNNVEKHAKAGSVWVVIDFHGRAVTVLIEDNGIGFESSESVGSESFGIMGMRERVSLLNGEFQIKSTPGQGTKVYAKIPIH